MTWSVKVSPPPANRTTTPSTFTEQQKAIIDPHHQPKILGQKQPINHCGDSSEPPMKCCHSVSVFIVFWGQRGEGELMRAKGVKESEGVKGE